MERNKRRAAMHIPRRCVERWLEFTRKALWACRKRYLNDTWTAHMRSNLSPKRDAQRKLCSLFRRYAHRRSLSQIAARAQGSRGGGESSMGARMDTGEHPSYLEEEISTDEELEADAIHRAIEDPELQQAIAMSLGSFNAPEPQGGRTAGTRSRDEAGIPATPGSARARKRSGRKH